MITVYVWKLKDGDTEFLSKMLKMTIGEEEYVPEHTVIELEDFTGKIRPIGTVLCMGIRPFNLVSFEYPDVIKLPPLIDLLPLPKNRDTRLEAWDTLTKIKNSLKTNIQDLNLELTPEELEDFYQKVAGVSPPEDSRASWLMHPSTVTCSYCGQQYKTYQQPTHL